MNIKRIVTGLLAALALSWAQTAYAQDNGTEFGIVDDLTVLGKAGTAVDPDVEIKGFTVFGSTQSAYLIPVDTGNVVLNGIVQVSSGLYVAGSSTFTSGAYFTGISSFSDVTKLYYGGGVAGQVLSKVAGGAMQWNTVSSMVSGDSLGNHIATMTVTANYGIVATTITATGDTRFGASTSDKHGINRAPEANVGLVIDGPGATIADYTAKFYSGGSLSAWIKKK